MGRGGIYVGTSLRGDMRCCINEILLYFMISYHVFIMFESNGGLSDEV